MRRGADDNAGKGNNEHCINMEEETLDTILNGHLRVFQKKKGYRFSLDSILLAHFVSLKPRTCAIDLGCGSGIILLILQNVSRTLIVPVWKFRKILRRWRKKTHNSMVWIGTVEILSGDARKIKDIF